MPSQGTARSLSDRYALKAPIGKGGMGVVWRAQDTLLQREVAIKEVHLPEELSGPDRDAVQGRVLREARAAARLGHPSVVTVYDVLREQGTAYIVMELVHGRTLSEVVEQEGPLEVERVARIGLEVLGGLDRAHREGIVHRDVKPANIMITDDGHVKLADFGIASLKGDPKLTATGILLGSPAYMSPEQAQDDESGTAADLWALGASLYHAVEGEAPFDRGKAIPTLTAVVYDEPRPARRAGVLEPTLMALLAKSPAERPEVAELRKALDDVVSGSSSPRSPRVAPETTRAPAVAVPPAAVWTDERAAPQDDHAPTRRNWILAAGALALLGLIAGFLLFGLVTDDRRPDRAGSDVPAQGDASGQQGTGGDSSGDGAGGGTDPEAGATDELPGDQDTSVTVPGDWITFTDEASGYAISHPPDWQVTEGSTDSDSVDFRDPETGSYMRVDWTDTPGDDPQQAWEDFAPEFAANHDNYVEIGITPTTFQGFDASLWEFTYSDGGTDLHAVDLGFVTGDYGFALNFQTRAENWASSQDIFEAFKASFEAPA
ncbi:hypothetical protein BH24ACT26_BH24ACT26_10350 [soil metagenome]